MKNQLKESYVGSSNKEASPSSELIEIILEIPECPISPNRWIGKKWGKHNEVKRWNRLIILAISKFCSTPTTEKGSMKITEGMSLSQFWMRSFLWGFPKTTRTSRQTSNRGWTRIKLTFKKNQIPLLDKISAKW